MSIQRGGRWFAEERWGGPLTGAVVGLAGTAVALAASSLLNHRVNPVVAVAEGVIEITPGPVAEKLISLVGQLDKPLLIIGVALGLVALSAWAGALARRRMAAGAAVFVAMGVVAGLAQAHRIGASTSSLLPVVLGVATWVVLLLMLSVPRSASSQAEGAATGRRGLLQLGGVALGSVVVGAAGHFLGARRRTIETVRTRLRLPVSRGAVPAGAQLDVQGLVPWRVSNEEFYRIDTALAVPTVDPDRWRLRIHGMVDRPITLTYADLLDRRLTEAWVTLCCVSNRVGGDLIGNAWWSGVRVAELLAAAGVHPDADAVLQTSHDGWTCGTPLAALTDDRNALLAVAMNGEPLPLDHGFPVRMVVPGLYGYVSATKWLVDLEVTRFDRFDAYWTERGWAERGPVKTQSRIDVPRGGRALAGSVVVAGVAWAQHTGIAKVEVQLDGGPWVTCELGSVPGNDTWVHWRTTVEASPGIHRVTVRATDRSGYTQTPVKSDVIPDGATGWHSLEFTADG